MAERQLTRMPVLDPEDGNKLVGMVSLEDLLSGRVHALTEERTRERVLRLRLPLPPFSARHPEAAAGDSEDE